MCALNVRAHKYMNQSLRKLKGDIESNIVTTEDFNAPLLVIARLFRENINKKMEDLNNIIN